MKLFTFSFLLSAFCLFGAVTYGQNPNCYRITFSDKNDSPYSVDRPEEFLSLRAIAKRERFNIPVIEQDLPVNPQYIEAILNFSNEPSQIISRSKWDNSVVIFYSETENCHGIIAEMINHFPFVVDTLSVAVYGKINDFEIIVHEQASTSIVYNSSCDYNYGNSIDNISLHKGHFLHKAGFCGEDMLICVIDAGFENFNTISYFQPLYENGQIWGTRDFISGINNVYLGHNHGTSTISIIVSAIEGQLIGSAPKANYFLFRTTSPWINNLVEEDFLAQAIEVADSLGADIITVSLGYRDNFDYEWQNIYTSADNDGMASIASRTASILAHKGVIFVCCAGNEGLSNWRHITRPADAKDILAVGMVNKYGVVNPMSSYGPSADWRVKPDVASPGDGAWIITSNGIIRQGGGTSAAAPIIAGLSACLWQALPQYSALEIMNLIRKYGDRYSNPNNRTGYGIPNFYQCYLDHTNSVPEKQISSVSVYPNPTMGELRIRNEELGIKSIEIFDVLGRKRSSNHLIISSSHHLINISHLNSGIYFFKITSDRSSEMIKVIKQ
ncbi:MAG: S8 family peptidase [Lentimicrobiaceae bacterium]|nr:S8 family peptidase [Lentimicrobiaceae bacterium]